MTNQELENLIEQLVKQPKESEWVEFKLNYHSGEEIGERLSALANGACLHNKPYGYLIFGVKDQTHVIEGTTFNAKTAKKGNEDLENWLIQRLNPHIDIRIHEFDYQNKQHISIYQIPAATNQPVDFINVAYIRIGSITRKLSEFPEKERKIWKKEQAKAFEKEIALNSLAADDIVRLLDTQCYFELMGLPYPATRDGVLERLIAEKLAIKDDNNYAITNLGGILFAKT
jgi:predicted HTH transcriptional regulator